MEGHGYEAYCHMPMGVQGAPSCFNDLTAQALHDIMLKLLLELYADDGSMAGDDFLELLGQLCMFFEHCHKMSLSLSPSKTMLFFTELVFGGSWVGHCPTI
jgi:hypothetical protein